MRRAISNDRGASIVVLSLGLFMLIGAAAIAIDLAAMRTDRSVDQKVSDSAAAAGALAAVTGDGQNACEAALAYVAANMSSISSLNDTGCASAFSSSCIAGTAESHTVTSGRHTFTVTYPVPDASPFMTSGLLGGTSQPVVAEDGDPCDRVAVQVSAVHSGLFARVLGFEQGTTTVHTVATAVLPSGGGVPLNLLVLDRFGCQAILVQGNGGVIVDAVVNEDGTGLIAGVAASDSDASSGCSSDGVIDIDGSNPIIRADGPEGCSNQTGTGTVGGFTSGHGCGLLQTLAPGTPGCNLPACTPGAGGANPPNPDPTALPARLTRAPIDYRYNCWTDYTSPPAGVSWAVDPLTTSNEQDIPGCGDGTSDHIYDLINAVGSSGSAGFTDWTTLGHPCLVPSSSPPITVTGDVRIDCATFTVQSDVQIVGNVIFDGDVNVTSGTAHLDVHNSLGSPGWTFFRDGTLTKDGQADLTFLYTAVYMSKTSNVAVSGGNDGKLVWVAPNSGNFDDLALWSDSATTHSWAGQGELRMEGVFFTPLALADYSGQGSQNQTEAQWVADKLLARGQGQLVIRPEFGRAVEFPILPRTTLIR